MTPWSIHQPLDALQSSGHMIPVSQCPLSRTPLAATCLVHLSSSLVASTTHLTSDKNGQESQEQVGSQDESHQTHPLRRKRKSKTRKYAKLS